MYKFKILMREKPKILYINSLSLSVSLGHERELGTDWARTGYGLGTGMGGTGHGHKRAGHGMGGLGTGGLGPGEGHNTSTGLGMGGLGTGTAWARDWAQGRAS
jgi:hypothetical protein